MKLDQPHQQQSTSCDAILRVGNVGCGPESCFMDVVGGCLTHHICLDDHIFQPFLNKTFPDVAQDLERGL
jgi:hypothetical protein